MARVRRSYWIVGTPPAHIGLYRDATGRVCCDTQRGSGRAQALAMSVEEAADLSTALYEIGAPVEPPYWLIGARAWYATIGALRLSRGNVNPSQGAEYYIDRGGEKLLTVPAQLLTVLAETLLVCARSD